jgi:hypothetical protein
VCSVCVCIKKSAHSLSLSLCVSPFFSQDHLQALFFRCKRESNYNQPARRRRCLNFERGCCCRQTQRQDANTPAVLNSTLLFFGNLAQCRFLGTARERLTNVDQSHATQPAVALIFYNLILRVINFLQLLLAKTFLLNFSPSLLSATQKAFRLS